MVAPACYSERTVLRFLFHSFTMWSVNPARFAARFVRQIAHPIPSSIDRGRRPLPSTLRKGMNLEALCAGGWVAYKVVPFFFPRKIYFVLL